MDHAGRLWIILRNQHERTSTYAVVCIRDVWFHYCKKQKETKSRSRATATDVVAVTTTSVATTAKATTATAAAVAAGHTKTGSASLYARLVCPTP